MYFYHLCLRLCDKPFYVARLAKAFEFFELRAMEILIDFFGVLPTLASSKYNPGNLAIDQETTFTTAIGHSGAKHIKCRRRRQQTSDLDTYLAIDKSYFVK
ncbi:hypothetical protein HGRIS_010617 [Hohenbuehelia grisea]|uniref:Uncharacterized protein n=1 Tax=Hohenbuehelia grisea TaxID=104357 RepID=A0ABR3IX88_9AGAR